MEAGNILSADVLDIIFDARNKDYGAYDLRKNYQRRLMKAVIITLLLVVLICLTYVLLGSMKTDKEKLMLGPDMILEKVKTPEKIVEAVIPPPVKATPPPAIKMQQFTKPLIVANPPENERPPEQADLADSKIGTVNADGQADDGIQAPVDEAKGIVEAPKKQDEGETVFTRVEIESTYPGGLGAWSTFLNRNLVYPQAAIDDDKQGTVTVQFIVDIEGKVSDVQAISGPEELRAAAAAVIKKSGMWIAAIQNGKKVKSYKKQPVVFKLEAQ